MSPWPEVVSHEMMRSRFVAQGPELTKSAVLVVIGGPATGRMYKRAEDGNWYLLDDQAHGTPPWKDEQSR